MPPMTTPFAIATLRGKLILIMSRKDNLKDDFYVEKAADVKKRW
jgi:hypothetical protein